MTTGNSQYTVSLRVAADTGAARNELRQVEQSLHGVEQAGVSAGGASSKSLAALEQRSRATAGGMGLFAAAIPLATVTLFAKELVSAAATMQDLETRLRGVTGSARDYAEADAYLIDLSQRHHKSLQALSDGYTKVLSLEKAGLLNKQQGRAITEGLSNATSALGASSAQLGQVMFGLSQALSSGTVRAEEFNQVTEPLPGLLQAMDKAAGLGAGGLRKLVNDGKVTSDFFRDTLIKALQDYDGAAARTASNLSAKFTDIGNAYDQLAKQLSTPITSTLTPVLDSTAAGLSRLTAVIAGFRGELSQVTVPPDLLQLTRTRGEPLGLTKPTGQQILAGDAAQRQQLLDGLRSSAGNPLEILAAKPAASADDTKAITRADLDHAEAIAKKAHNLAALTDVYTRQLLLDGKLSEAAARHIAEQRVSIEQLNQAAGAASKQVAATERRSKAGEQLIAELQSEIQYLQISSRENALQTEVRQNTAKGVESQRAQLEALTRQHYELTEAVKAKDKAERLAAESAKDLATLRLDTADAERLASLADELKLQGATNDEIAKRISLEQALANTRKQYPGAGQDEALSLTARSEEARQRLADITEQDSNDLSEYAKRAAQNMQSSFADFLFDPFQKGMDGMVLGFAQTVQRMAAEAASAKLLETLLGDMGDKKGWGILGSLAKSVGGAMLGGVGGATAGAGESAVLNELYPHGPMRRMADKAPFAAPPHRVPQGRAESAGAAPVIQIFDQRGRGAPIEASQSVDPATGEALIRIVVRDELARGGQDMVNGVILSGRADRAMSASYGVRRTGRPK